MGWECAIRLWEQFPGLDEIWAVGRRKERLVKLEEKSKYSGAQICSGSESGKRTGDLKS